MTHVLTMTASPVITLRPPAAGDVLPVSKVVVEAFGAIADRHNFARDFTSFEVVHGFIESMLHHPAIHGVIAESPEGDVIGSNFLDERDAIAGVGPLSVCVGAQSKGTGRQLMKAVIERAKMIGAPGVRLVQDAFNTTSMSLYASLGFEAREPLALMRGTPRSAARGSTEVRPLIEADLAAAGDLHRRVHGFDRNGALRDCLKPFGSLGLFRNGRLTAYAAAPTFWLTNHGVAESEQDLRDLLMVAGRRTGGRPLELLVPVRRASLFRWLIAEGLRVVKPMTLMTMGEYREPAAAFFPSVTY